MKKLITSICLCFLSFIVAQESLNMDLVGQLSYTQGTNDIWGKYDGLHYVWLYVLGDVSIVFATVLFIALVTV